MSSSNDFKQFSTFDNYTEPSTNYKTERLSEPNPGKSKTKQMEQLEQVEALRQIAFRELEFFDENVEYGIQNCADTIATQFYDYLLKSNLPDNAKEHFIASYEAEQEAEQNG